MENDVTNEVDECDIGEWSKTTDTIPNVTADWLTTLDLNAVSILLGFAVVGSAGTPVAGHTQDFTAAGWEFETVYRLGYQHHDTDGSIIAPATLTMAADPDGTPVALVLWTDYDVVDNGFGEFGLIFHVGTNLPDNADLLRVTYSYTPLAAEYTGYLIGQTIQPYMIVKLVGCPDTDGLYDTRYIVKASLSGSLDTNFISTGEVPLSSVTLTWGKGWYKLVKRTRL